MTPLYSFNPLDTYCDSNGLIDIVATVEDFDMPNNYPQILESPPLAQIRGANNLEQLTNVNMQENDSDAHQNIVSSVSIVSIILPRKKRDQSTQNNAVDIITSPLKKQRQHIDHKVTDHQKSKHQSKLKSHVRKHF